jgi:acyl-CoA reductase-like NAD-dependent aldehyde dehydrogenase
MGFGGNRTGKQEIPMSAELTMDKPYRNFINGVWESSQSARDVIDPANNRPFASFYEAGQEEAERAAASSKRAFDNSEWRKNPSLRAKALLRLADLIRSSAEDLAHLETLQTGHPIKETRLAIGAAVANFEYFAGLTDKIEGDCIPVSSNAFSYTIREALGVTAHIVPWNHPFLLMARGVAPALAYGNTAVIKPSVTAPLTNLEFGRLVEQAGLPAGVVNIVCGSGAVCGEALAGNPQVRKIVFTGSLEAGQRVMELAVKNLTPVLLELGGKAPFIVCDDVDMDEALDGVLMTALSGQGEICFAGTRFLIPASIYDTFAEQLVKRVASIRLGPGIREETEMGPLITARHLASVDRYVQEAREQGARIYTGGARADTGELAAGNFYLPTIVDQVAHDARICKEEVFGPVLTLMKYETEDEALAIANKVDFGLSAFVWTNDLRRAHRLAAGLESGSVSVFSYGYGAMIPRGGYKLSGLGRECGQHAVEEYTQIKNVTIGLARFPTKYARR